MTDATPKKRAWFQLHLSTCVVLMVVAGAFLGANIIKRKALSPIKELSYRHETKNIENGDNVLVKYVRVHRRRYEYTGWPVVIYEKGESASFEVSRQAEAPRTGVVYTLEMIAEEIGDNFPEKFAEAYGPKWSRQGILINLMALLLCLAITAAVCEFFEALRTFLRKQLAS